MNLKKFKFYFINFILIIIREINNKRLMTQMTAEVAARGKQENPLSQGLLRISQLHRTVFWPGRL